jgi:release factor glutamine methyltransferase
LDYRDLDEGSVYKQTVAKLRDAGCVFAEEEARLLIAAAQTRGELQFLLEKRAAGFPLEHVIGWVEFCGLRLVVEPGVFVPRYRTEFLVQQALARCWPGDLVVDLCCGSGALGAVLAAVMKRVELYAVDIDPLAVHNARRNIPADDGFVYEGDLFSPLPVRLRGRINILIANAPYVPTDAIRLLPQEARIHEPQVALDGGADGLDVQRRIVAEAPLWLAEDGYLLMETSARQAPLTEELFARHGLQPERIQSEERDATVIIGTRAGHRTE